MSDNPQFIRTDNAIVHALAVLLKRKPFEKITVQDILEETPVTRATFYAHFRDKYDIAERIMDSFFLARRSVKETLRMGDTTPMEILRKRFPVTQDHVDLLLNIHTEKVDFRRAMAQELEKEYLTANAGPNQEIEARIYAQAGVEMYLSMLRGEMEDINPRVTNEIVVNAALGLLRLPKNDEAYAYLLQRANGHQKAY